MLRHPIWRPASGVEASTLGVMTSLVVHAAVIGACAFLTRERDHYAKGGSTELVRFLVPPDQVPRRAVHSERVEWVRTGLPDGWGVSDVDGQRIAAEIDATARRGERGPDPELDRPRPQEFDELLGDSPIFSAMEVDSGVVRHPGSGAPLYPAELLAADVEGMVRARYVVDTAGRVDSASFTIVSATHPAFAAAVLEAVPRMRFSPAIASGRRVAQLVEQTFEFRVAKPRAEKVSSRPPAGGRTLAGLADGTALTDHAT